MIDDSRGKSAYAVFAARVRIAAVANCSTTYRTVPLPNTAAPSCDITVLLLARVRAEVVGEDLHAHEQRAEDDAHPHQRGGRVLRLRAAERGHAVRDRLDPGERDRARREALQQEEDAERAADEVVARRP